MTLRSIRTVISVTILSAMTGLCMSTLGAEPANPPRPDSGAGWVRVTEHAAFSPRDTAKGAVFQGKMWLSNGYYHGGKLSRDLWSSTDGSKWVLVQPNTPYDGYSELVAYKDRLWAIKGSIWSSTDGVTWTRLVERSPAGAGKVVVHDGKMWQLSGAAVWHSSDGVSWTRVPGTAPYGPRSSFALIVFDGKIWVMGGAVSRPNTPPEKGYPKTTTLNDVWSSADGVKWTQAVEHAPWAPRMWIGGHAYAGKMWILGGFDNVHHTNLGDVWTSVDGQHWERFVAQPSFSPRHEPTCYVYADSLWMVAGNTWPVVNDVWRLTLPGAAGK